MMYEDIFEPVEVITLFQYGKMKPLRFRWNERTYRISKIHGGWVSDEGINRFYHFSVSAEGPDCFELTFDSRNLTWELSRVCMEG